MTITRLVGTGICLVIERDPIALAKEVASWISSQRSLPLRIGGGWNVEEMDNHGTELPCAGRSCANAWGDEGASGATTKRSTAASWSIRAHLVVAEAGRSKPHPSGASLGATVARTLERVIEYGDEWMPIGGRGGHHLAERIAELQTMAKAAGREPIPVSISVHRMGRTRKPSSTWLRSV